MKRANFPSRKERRQQEAVERQKVYDALPAEEKARRNPKKEQKS